MLFFPLIIQDVLCSGDLHSLIQALQSRCRNRATHESRQILSKIPGCFTTIGTYDACCLLKRFKMLSFYVGPGSIACYIAGVYSPRPGRGEIFLWFPMTSGTSESVRTTPRRGREITFQGSTPVLVTEMCGTTAHKWTMGCLPGVSQESGALSQRSRTVQPHSSGQPGRGLIIYDYIGSIFFQFLI